MRAIPIASILAILTLIAAPLALADDDAAGERSDKGRETSATQRAAHANHTDDDNDAREHNESREARHAARENATANRTAAMERFLTALHALRESWLENATKVRDTCKDAAFDRANATSEERAENAQCIRDGYADWREQYRAELREMRAQLKELLSWGQSRRGSHA